MEKIKILLIDDEVEFLGLMNSRISSWGHEVIEAQNGKEAIDAVRKKAPDIIILDYVMPDIDGVGVLREIRKINKTIPVIMFTAYPDMKVEKEAEKLGVGAFIPKLSTYQDVQANLKSAIDIVKKKLEKK